MTVLAARSTTFAYPRARSPIVVDWSESFEAGALTAITGGSGSGKSTRLFLLATLLRPDSGEILFNGTRIDALPDAVRSRFRAEHCGFIFQDAALDGTRSIIDNITESALYRGRSRREAEPLALDLLEAVALDLPPARRPGEISGGQAQRIALCRALIGNPDIIFADEPTGNLDAQTGSLVMDVLAKRAHAGAIVIVVTHDAEVAAVADRRIAIGGDA
ncbi:ABC transporter ATP-binding protein [Actinomyces culturomici]|uniref:ABC transporter ATP-binding protein n=1 Tax=Actinomyces culturomici TaxID=1926276 RepID=UPI000E2028CF|nr:ABC transporter ATP-binding protein [Actinomyces culturomici]